MKILLFPFLSLRGAKARGGSLSKEARLITLAVDSIVGYSLFDDLRFLLADSGESILSDSSKESSLEMSAIVFES